MDASSFPMIPLLLPFPHNHIVNDNDDNDHYPIFPAIPAADHDDDDDGDTLSLCDLPLHSINHSAPPSPPRANHVADDQDYEEDAFEFSREYSFTADHHHALQYAPYNVITTGDRDINNNNNNSTNSIVFCGKIIAHRQLALPEKQQRPAADEKKRKQEEVKKNKTKHMIISSTTPTTRIFPWKPFSSSSSSSSSSSCSTPPEKKKKKKKKATHVSGRSTSRGYLCLAIGMEWKFPVRSMDLKDIKLRQSRRNSFTSLDHFDVSTPSSSSSSIPLADSAAVGTKSSTSGKGLWCLLRVLAGARP